VRKDNAVFFLKKEKNKDFFVKIFSCSFINTSAGIRGQPVCSIASFLEIG